MCGCTIPCKQAAREVSLDRVGDGLFIGPIQAAWLDADLARNHITAVINVSGSRYTHRPGLEYLEFDVEDTSEGAAALGSILPQCMRFIYQNKPVLVHCQAGKSRSATICAAYLIESESLSADDAIAVVQSAHPRADPNPGFRALLAEMGKKVKDRDKPLDPWR